MNVKKQSPGEPSDPKRGPRGRKIADYEQMKRWLLEGHTHAKIAKMHEEKYGIAISRNTVAAFASRNNMPKRINSADDMIPWQIDERHQNSWAEKMLRAESRARKGMSVADSYGEHLSVWRANLREREAVVHYDPDTEQGFFYVPARPGEDLIRDPD